MTSNRAWIFLAACLMNPLAAASANVVTDWDEKAVGYIQPRMVPPAAYRAMAIVHIAMFDAVNSIEPLYRSYQNSSPATKDTSKDAAAAAAAGTVLKNLFPDAASDIQAALTSYLAGIPDSDAKSNGINLGEAVATKCLEGRGSDGASVADAYRPVTTAGVYIPTALTVAPQWPELMPFAMTSPSQFRPQPPVALESEQWAKDYNEIKRAWRQEQQQAFCATDRGRAILAVDRTLEHASAGASDRHSKTDVGYRQCPLHGGDNGRGSGRHDRRDGRQVQVRLLAPDHRHP